MNHQQSLAAEVQSLLDGAPGGRVPERMWLCAGDLAALMAIEPGAHEYRDLVVTLHDAARRSLDDLSVTIADALGSVATCRVTKRNQVRFRSVGPQPWVIRARVHDPAAPALAINRRLPAAAASDPYELSYVLASENGAVIAHLHEDPEHHLLLELRGHLDSAELARIRWSMARRDGDAAERSLLTPLAPTAGESIAGYDLGSVADATGVKLFPVEIVDGTDLSLEDLGDTCTTTWRGSARRGWQAWLARNRCDPLFRTAVQRAIR